MASAARKSKQAPSTIPAIDVFTLRAWARATLFEAAVFDLHEAVDVLQVAAVDSGLVKEIGQDAVQRIMAAEFHAVCR